MLKKILLALSIMIVISTIVIYSMFFSSGSSQASVNTSSMGEIIPYTPRFDRSKPVIAVIAENEYAELLDYVIPYSILSMSGIADVKAIGMRSEPIQFSPSTIRIVPNASIRAFDSLFPEGADYVIVPATRQTPMLLEWIRSQAEKGSTIVSICNGVSVLASAGLLDNKKGTGHWTAMRLFEIKFPETEWVRNARYISDGKIITSSGITSSIPLSIALVEAIAGPEKARELATYVGIENWSNQHDSGNFRFNTNFFLKTIGNKISFWSHEDIAIPITEGVDEVALALVSDIYARTFLAKTFTFQSTKKPLVSKQGLTLLADKIQTTSQDFSNEADRFLKLQTDLSLTAHLETTLRMIENHYGEGTAEFIALQLEYPYGDREEEF